MIIYKYRIPEDGIIKMPVGAEILSVGLQNGTDEVLWAKVDPDETEMEERFFKVKTTGKSFDDNGLEYIGSSKSDEAGYVSHLFEADSAPEDDYPWDSPDMKDEENADDNLSEMM